MHVLRLDVENFRSWHQAGIEPHSGTNLLLGHNGAGKSNLIEAIHVCALGFSPRSRRDPELVRWGSDRFVCRLEASNNNEPVHLAASCDREGFKETRVNGKAGKLFSQLVGHVSVVGLYPEDLELVRGAPAARRSYLDSLICQQDPKAVEEFRAYARVVRQRNAAFKDPDRYDGEVREVLDRQWRELAVPVLMRRLKILQDLEPRVAKAYAAVSGGQETAGMWYQGSYGDEDLPIDAQGLSDRLKLRAQRLQRAEASAQTTLAGPHRDDLILQLEGRTARDTASQGQSRSLAIAMRLAASELLVERTGQMPVLLLDDVFAELDGPRRERLASLLPRQGQSFLCSPRRADLPFEVDRTFILDQGKLQEAR